MDELPIVKALRGPSEAPFADRFEAADVIAALVDALLGAEGAIQAMGSQVDAEWRDHDKAATRHDSTVRAWRAKRDAALAKATQ